MAKITALCKAHIIAYIMTSMVVLHMVHIVSLLMNSGMASTWLNSSLYNDRNYTPLYWPSSSLQMTRIIAHYMAHITGYIKTIIISQYMTHIVACIMTSLMSLSIASLVAYILARIIVLHMAHRVAYIMTRIAHCMAHILDCILTKVNE
jgi:hypothetical protein